MVTLGFVAALAVVSFLMGIVIGFMVQIAASQFKLGPAPRAVLGLGVIVAITIPLVIEFGIPYLAPLIVVAYYIGTFQVGTRLGYLVGLQAPDDDEPPKVMWELMNRYN